VIDVRNAPLDAFTCRLPLRPNTPILACLTKRRVRIKISQFDAFTVVKADFGVKDGCRKKIDV
jgi:hypothetical protein